MVNVEQKQQNRFARARNNINRAFKYRMKMTTIAQAGQGVLEGQTAQAINQSLQVGSMRFTGLGLDILRIVFQQGTRVYELQVLQHDR